MHNSTEDNLLLWKGAIMQCLGWNLSASIWKFSENMLKFGS